MVELVDREFGFEGSGSQTSVLGGSPGFAGVLQLGLFATGFLDASHPNAVIVGMNNVSITLVLRFIVLIPW